MNITINSISLSTDGNSLHFIYTLTLDQGYGKWWGLDLYLDGTNLGTVTSIDTGNLGYFDIDYAGEGYYWLRLWYYEGETFTSKDSSSVYYSDPIIKATIKHYVDNSYSGYDSSNQGKSPKHNWYINVEITDYVPTKEGYDFDGWVIQNYSTQHYYSGDYVGVEASEIGTVYRADAQWKRKVVEVNLVGTVTSDTIHVNAPSGVPNDSTFFVWQLYQGDTKKVDDSKSELDAYEFTGLTKGTQYTVKFGAYTAASNGELTAKGEQDFTTVSSNVWIYTGANNDTNGWQLAAPYIYTSSGWKEAQTYIYSNGWILC